MATTTTFGPFAVDDGERQTVPFGDLSQERILDVDVTFTGVSETETTTTTSTDFKTVTDCDSATAVQKSTSSSTYAQNTATSRWAERTASAQSSSVPDGYEFDHLEVRFLARKTDTGAATVPIKRVGYGGGRSSNVTFVGPETKTVGTDQSYNEDNLSEFVSIQDKIGVKDIQVRVEVTVVGKSTTSNTYLKDRTASASFPSVPSGYNFTEHNLTITRNGTVDTSETFSTNRVGETESATSNDASTNVTVTAETVGWKTETTTTTTTFNTEDPAIKGDLTASVSDTLDGGSSTTVTGAGLDDTLADDVDVYYSINGVETVEVEYTVTHEPAAATPARGVVAFYDPDTDLWREAAVAETSDPQLVESSWQVYDDTTGAWYAVDLVPLTHDLAIEQAAVYDATDGAWKAPRQASTTTT